MTRLKRSDREYLRVQHAIRSIRSGKFSTTDEIIRFVSQDGGPPIPRNRIHKRLREAGPHRRKELSAEERRELYEQTGEQSEYAWTILITKTGGENENGKT